VNLAKKCANSFLVKLYSAAIRCGFVSQIRYSNNDHPRENGGEAYYVWIGIVRH